MNENTNTNQSRSLGTCESSHHKFVPLIIAIVGVFFLANAFGFVNFYWTEVVVGLLVFVVGAIKTCTPDCKCCPKKQ